MNQSGLRRRRGTRIVRGDERRRGRDADGPWRRVATDNPRRRASRRRYAPGDTGPGAAAAKGGRLNEPALTSARLLRLAAARGNGSWWSGFDPEALAALARKADTDAALRAVAATAADVASSVRSAREACVALTVLGNTLTRRAGRAATGLAIDPAALRFSKEAHDRALAVAAGRSELLDEIGDAYPRPRRNRLL